MFQQCSRDENFILDVTAPPTCPPVAQLAEDLLGKVGQRKLEVLLCLTLKKSIEKIQGAKGYEDRLVNMIICA